MTIFQSLVLGIVQGLTEFLPISSSGHLALLSHIPAWNAQPLVFDTTLHLATALTLVVYFWNDLFRLASSFLRDLFSKTFQFNKYAQDSKLLFYIGVGSIPAAVFGFLFENAFEEKFRSVSSVALFMLLGTLLMMVAQKIGKNKNALSSLTVGKSLLVGLFQSLALFPGVSRSGSTISGGLIFGLNRTDAARFSFLMSIPIVVFAGVYKIISTNWSAIDVSFSVLAIGFISSFVVGLGVVHFLLEYLKKRNLNIFIWYRLLLVLVLSVLISR